MYYNLCANRNYMHRLDKTQYSFVIFQNNTHLNVIYFTDNTHAIPPQKLLLLKLKNTGNQRPSLY